MQNVIKNRVWPAYVLLILGSLIMVFPFVWSLLTSFKTLNESLKVPPALLPQSWQLVSYEDVVTAYPFHLFFFNTFGMIIIRLLSTLLISSMAAYAFARIPFFGRGYLFLVCLIPMMVPSQIFIYPQYMIAVKLKITNSILGLALPGIASTFGIFMLRQHFMTIPDALEEAAILDGCGRGRIFLSIMLPLSKTPLISLGIFTALFAYKDLMWPLICNTKIETMTLSSGLAYLQGQYTTHYPQLMAGSIIAMLPMIILFIIFQKQFIGGIATTGLK
jgi:multiple sugar transport system permease protein